MLPGVATELALVSPITWVFSHPIDHNGPILVESKFFGILRLRLVFFLKDQRAKGKIKLLW